MSSQGWCLYMLDAPVTLLLCSCIHSTSCRVWQSLSPFDCSAPCDLILPSRPCLFQQVCRWTLSRPASAASWTSGPSTAPRTASTSATARRRRIELCCSSWSRKAPSTPSPNWTTGERGGERTRKRLCYTPFFITRNARIILG